MSVEPDAPETAAQVDHRFRAAFPGVLALLLRLPRVGPQKLLQAASGGRSSLLRTRAEWVGT